MDSSADSPLPQLDWQPTGGQSGEVGGRFRGADGFVYQFTALLVRQWRLIARPSKGNAMVITSGETTCTDEPSGDNSFDWWLRCQWQIHEQMVRKHGSFSGHGHDPSGNCRITYHVELSDGRTVPAWSVERNIFCCPIHEAVAAGGPLEAWELEVLTGDTTN